MSDEEFICTCGHTTLIEGDSEDIFLREEDKGVFVVDLLSTHTCNCKGK